MAGTHRLHQQPGRRLHQFVDPGVEDRGANDHYALRGRIAWQPTEDDGRQPDPALHARGQGAAGGPLFARARLPECPAAGRVHAAGRDPARSGGPAKARPARAFATTRSFRAAAAIPGRPRRPRRPTSTATIRAATLRIDSSIGDARLRLDHRLPERRTSSTSRAATPRRIGRRGVLPGQRPRAVLGGAAAVGRLRVESARRRPVLHERRRRLHRAVRRSVLRRYFHGCVPTAPTYRSSRPRRKRPRSPSSCRTSGRRRTS